MSFDSSVNASMLELAAAAEGEASQAKAAANTIMPEVSQAKAGTLALSCDSGIDASMAELTGPANGEETQATACTFAAPKDESTSRIEMLLEQQNELMLRHLRLVEDSRRHADSMQGILLQSPRTILKSLDPSVQVIFKEWHAEFQSKVSVYVKQSQLLNQYQVSAAKDGHIAPFSDEAKYTWQWPEAYLAKAQPIGHDLAEPGAAYDVKAAFVALRQKHAEEVHFFVMSHQDACVKQLSGELALSATCDSLVQRAKAWAAMHRNLFHDPSRTEHLLIQQAQGFAQLVYREEMSKADIKIKDNGLVMSPKLLLALRCLCAFAILLSSVSLEAEHLARLGAMLFALGCGMALFWEEKFTQSTKALLGSQSPWQLLSHVHSIKAVVGGLSPGQLLNHMVQRDFSKAVPGPRPPPAAEEVN